MSGSVDPTISGLFNSRRSISAPTGKMRVFEGVKGGKYFLVETLDQFSEFLELAKRQRSLCVDTETSGLNWVHDDVCGIVVGWGVENNYYIPIDHKTGEKQLNILDILPQLQALLGNPNLILIFANAKFDLHGLRKLGIEVYGIVHDIVIIAHLLDENADHGVKEMSVRYIDVHADKFEKMITEWRANEAKRRRQEFQDKARARVADIISDKVMFVRIANTFNVSVKEIEEDLKLRKKLALEMAKLDLADHICSKNKKEDVTYDYIPIPTITPYACADTHYTWLLYKKLIIDVAGHDSLKKLYINEMALLRVLFNAEHEGVHVDVPYLKQLEPKFDTDIHQLETSIYDAVGYEFNIGSAQQLTEALQKAGIQLTKLTKASKEAQRSGQTEIKYAVDKEVLEFLGAKYAFAEQILTYRKLEKLKGTYILNIQHLVDKNSYLHCDYNQNVTTGRMSSKEPNLQNIPARDKVIRKAFITPDGEEYIFVFIDYSQVELRLTADRSQDDTLLSCYPFEGKGQDVHTLTLADVVLGKPLDVVQQMKSDKTGHVSELQRGQSCECPACSYEFYRNIAKRVNFGIIYGAGPEAIQRQVSRPTRFVSKEECMEYIKRYFDKYPGVKEWIMVTQAFMKRYGFVQNTFGRYRRLPTQGLAKWQVERACRQGVNFLIQGEAADLFKTAAVRVNEIFKRENCKTRLVNFVHDELQFYWHKSELHLLKEVKKVMEDFSYKVPIVAEISYSPTDWGSKKELKA